MEGSRRTMTKDEFNQEFNCEFSALVGQFFSHRLFRGAIRHDVKLLREED